MPMNEQPPWGQNKKPSGPEDLLATLIQKIRDAFAEKEETEKPGGEQQDPSPSFSIGSLASKLIIVIIAVTLLQGVLTSFFTIQPGEVGVVLRFGQYNRTVNHGLHFKIPYMETLDKVDVETVRKEEFGFRTQQASTSRLSAGNNYDTESLMLTGDKDVIEVAWVVQYKVSDPVKFLFQVRNVPQALRDASETVTRRIVGNMDFDYVLSNREILAGDAKQELQAQMNRLQCGINILTLRLLDINPPERVKPAFNEVNMADQDMKRLVNEAEKTYNEVIPKARGKAKQIVENAQGYAAARTNRAMGEANRFQAIAKEYVAAPVVTRQRLYLESMEDVLPHVGHLYIMDRHQQNLLPLFDLTRKSLPAAPPAEGSNK